MDFILTASVLSYHRFLPVPIFVIAHKMMSPHYLSCFHQKQAACQWHPGNKELGGLHPLW